MEALVNFSPSYYRYPRSISRGYWGRYALDIDLPTEAQKRRSEWLDNVHRLSNTPFHDHVLFRYSHGQDYEVFLNLLQRHGIFIEKFFHRALRHRVLGEMATDPEELGNLKALMESAWGYETTFGNNPTNDVSFVLDHMFEQYLFQLLNDLDSYQILVEWYNRHVPARQCTICGSSYRLIDLPDWVYAGSGGASVCCMRCPIVQYPSKKVLLSHLREFVRACGFIPPANANPLNYSFTCRLSSEQWAPVFTAYGKMGGVDHVKNKWTSWFTAMASSGVLPDGVISTTRGIRCLAKDGHECRSLDEQQIDNWLTNNALQHEREPAYPFHPLLNPKGRRRSDWLVGDIYVEYFGLTGEKEYDKKTDEKIMLSKQLGITMLPIYPSDMVALDDKLQVLLREEK